MNWGIGSNIPYIIQITIDIWNSFFLFAIAFLLITVQLKSKRVYKDMKPLPLTAELIMLSISVFLYNLFDAVSLFFNGYPGSTGRIMKFIGEYGYYLTGLFLMLLLINTVCGFIKKENESIPVLIFCKISILLQVIKLAMILLNPFLRTLFYIDESNIYSRSLPYYYLWSALNFASVAIITVICILKHRSFNPMQKKAVYIILSITAASIIGNIFIYKISLHCIGVSLITILLYTIYSKNRIEIMAKNYTYTEKLKTDLLLSQIRPHFVHNSITAMVYYADKDVEKTRSALIDFSKYLRRNIDCVNTDQLGTIEEEIEHVRSYISLAKLRFGDDLKVDFDLCSGSFLIPVLTVQPLVENAVKHGIKASESGCGTITIHTGEDENNNIVTVSDTGAGFDTGILSNICGTHTGLKSVKTRLNLFCNGNLSIKSTPGGGTTCTISIPKSERHYENTDN